MEQEEFIDYLKLACQNLQFTKGLQFNLEMELKRVLKSKTHDQVKKYYLLKNSGTSMVQEWYGCWYNYETSIKVDI